MHPYDGPYDYPYDDVDDYPTSPQVHHLVFLDGLLVDSWREPAIGTQWADRVRPPDPPRVPPPAPLHERVADWLADVCGGRARVDTLAPGGLGDDVPDLPAEYPAHGLRSRAEDAAELLDLLARRHFTPEAAVAFRRGLLALLTDDPDTVLRPSTAAHLAGGICWAVAKANGLLAPAGTTRVGAIQDTLGLRSAPSSSGTLVAGALRGFRGRAELGRPPGVPDLLELGRTELLLGSTRARLLRIREQVRAAAEAA